jgi:magnesium transporter
MVASFFGMNVDLPFQHHPMAFFFALSLAVFLAGLTAFVFWKKRYF